MPHNATPVSRRRIAAELWAAIWQHRLRVVAAVACLLLVSVLASIMPTR